MTLGSPEGYCRTQGRGPGREQEAVHLHLVAPGSQVQVGLEGSGEETVPCAPLGASPDADEVGHTCTPVHELASMTWQGGGTITQVCRQRAQGARPMGGAPSWVL